MNFYFEQSIEKRFENSKNIGQILEKSKNIYFIGIGGIGLSALAILFKSIGKNVAGSDQAESEITKSLQKNQIIIFKGHSKENIEKAIDIIGNINLVIYSPAVTEDNIELLYFKEKNIPCINYGQALSYFINNYNSVSVCGTHGKSSTTAILSEILLEKNINISFLCGAVLIRYDTNAIFKENPKFFIAESCEYKETFLNFFPKNVIIPSLEVDHLDYYINSENYFKAFMAFLDQIDNGILVLRIEKEMEKKLFEYSLRLKNIKKIVPYFDDSVSNDFLTNLNFKSEYFTYQFNEKDSTKLKINKKVIENSLDRNIMSLLFELPIPCKEYAANFTSIFSFLDSFNLIDNETIKNAQNYHGLKRRFETIGYDSNNNLIISDYAHHPSEISTLLSIARLKYPKKNKYLIFQAHQHSRTRLLLNEFLNLFKDVENIIILPIYRQRDSEEDVKIMSSERFYDEVKKVNKKAIFFVDYFKLYEFLSCKKDSIFLFTGAGSIDNIAKEYYKGFYKRGD